MRRWIILFTCFCGLLHAQTKDYRLVGTLRADGSDLIPLELKFEVDQEGRLEGTSVTNFFSQDRTKSRIIGQVDFEKDRLSFREVENLFTRSDADEQEFCYVQVLDMSWKEEGSKAVYEGRFVGYFPDSSLCAEGAIILASPEMLEQVIKKNPKKIRKILDSVSVAKDIGSTMDVPASVEEKPVSLEAPGEVKKIEHIQWTSEYIRIAIWDFSDVDGDRIDIYVNGALHAADQEVGAQKKNYRIRMEGDTCRISVVAKNEGRIAPNTFRAQLLDSERSHSVGSRLKQGESVVFLLNRGN
jgi:hypothetical protein